LLLWLILPWRPVGSAQTFRVTSACPAAMGSAVNVVAGLAIQVFLRNGSSSPAFKINL
jgi:hypothetical protein